MTFMLDSAAQLTWRFTFTLVVGAAVALVILARTWRLRTMIERDEPFVPLSPTERQVWFVPLFVAGIEGMGNLSLAMQCRFGATPQQNINNILLASGGMAIIIIVTAAIGMAGQSVAGGRSLLALPPGVVGGLTSILAAWVFVLWVLASSGVTLEYLN